MVRLVKLVIRGFSLTEPQFSTHFGYHHGFRHFTTESCHLHTASPFPVNPDHLLRVCTILYQLQHSPDSKLHSKLSSSAFQLTHEFFLQVCNKFPYSWRPVYRFFQYTQQASHSQFSHTSLTFNKMLDIIGKSRNIDLFWNMVEEMGRCGLVNDKTFVLALKTLALARELKKCVQFFHLMNGFGFEYDVERMNKVVESLCKAKLVQEAKFVVMKLKEWITPNDVTYGWLVKGFCDAGDMIEASKMWNLMVDENLEPRIDVFNKMIDTLFKKNEYDEAMKMFDTMRVRRANGLGLPTYDLVIGWLCKRGKLGQAKILFDDMLKRGVQADNSTLESLVFGLLVKRRVQEAYKVVEVIEKPDIGVYHALIKGFVRLRRPSEASQVFREMIKRGCEPVMHTYVMLLQGHLGKRGRKGQDPLVNFDTIFVGGLVKAGKLQEATKYVERTMKRGLEVPKFDYNKFLHYYSSEDGVLMFEEMGKKLRKIGLMDLADIFSRYGEKMATRARRRNRAVESLEV